MKLKKEIIKINVLNKDSNSNCNYIVNLINTYLNIYMT